jgi:RNA recognition motif-containing protein
VLEKGLEYIRETGGIKMNKKIFIGNLDFKLKTEDLEKMFSEFGEIEDCVVITDRETNRSKGFGFVTFVEENDAKKAVESMNGKDLDGRKLTVNVAEEKERPERSGRPKFERREPEEEDEYSRYASTVGK